MVSQENGKTEKHFFLTPPLRHAGTKIENLDFSLLHFFFQKDNLSLQGIIEFFHHLQGLFGEGGNDASPPNISLISLKSLGTLLSKLLVVEFLREFTLAVT